jgi:hypothetical protein
VPAWPLFCQPITEELRFTCSALIGPLGIAWTWTTTTTTILTAACWPRPFPRETDMVKRDYGKTIIANIKAKKETKPMNVIPKQRKRQMANQLLPTKAWKLRQSPKQIKEQWIINWPTNFLEIINLNGLKISLLYTLFFLWPRTSFIMLSISHETSLLYASFLLISYYSPLRSFTISVFQTKFIERAATVERFGLKNKQLQIFYASQ